MKNLFSCLAVASMAMTTPLSANEMSEPNFHVVRLQVDGTENNEGGLVTWEGEGWYGGDLDKIVLRTKGEMQNGHVEASELWGLWSRNVSDFWDLQAGVRQDIDPHPTTSLVIGVEGMLPQFIETHAHGFVSTRGDVSARLEQSIDLAITQRLILEPHTELNVYASDVPELAIGSGISSIEAGAQLRYEVTRKFAPYVDLVYETATGNTARIKRNNGDDPSDLTLRIGLRIAF
ncbi:MAG: copper resistance protein B [Pseudomonadota bacterium]